MDENNILNYIFNLPVGELSNLPIAELSDCQEKLNKLAENVQLAKNWLDGALKLKYTALISQQRISQNKLSQKITIQDGDFYIEENRPLIPFWDSKKLKDFADHIINAGGNPADYMDVSFSISPEKYKRLSDDVKKSINAACIIQEGQPELKIYKGVTTDA